MYKSLDDLSVDVYENTDKLEDCMVREQVLDCAREVLEKMEEVNDLQERYFEEVGINPRSSFAGIVDHEIFEYLMMVGLRKRFTNRAYKVNVSVVEYGDFGQDHVMITICD